MRKMATRPLFATILSAFYFVSNVALLNAQEINVWGDRRRKIEQKEIQTAYNVLIPPAVKDPLHTSGFVKTKERADLFSAMTDKSTADPLLFAISRSYGSLREIFMSPKADAPFVVLIQDVHLNTEVQSHIAKLILEIKEAAAASGRGEVKVAVEGAFGPFDFARFRAFPDKKLTQALSDVFLSENKIAAPSYVGLTSEDAPVFYGVDDAESYQANVEAVRNAEAYRPAALDRLAQEETRVQAELDRSQNAGLKDFLKWQEARERGAVGLGDYVLQLQKILKMAVMEDGAEEISAGSADMEFVLEQFIAAYELEKSLDFSKVERQRSAIIERLVQRLDKKSLDRLVAQSLAYRAGRLTYADYYRGIQVMLTLSRIPHADMDAFQDYIRYVLLAEGISGEKLMEAVLSLEKRAVSRLVSVKTEARLLLERRRLSLSKKMVEFSLTPSEWDEYREHRVPGLESYESFYDQADIRSQKMVENLSQNWANQPRPVQVLIVGGFHAPHIGNLLKERGISFATLQPKITKVEAENGVAYLSIFTREKTPLDRLFEGEKLFLAPTQTAVGSANAAAAGPTRQILSALAIGNNVVPPETGVRKNVLGSGVVRLQFNGWAGEILAVLTEKIPAGFQVVERVTLPLVGSVRYVVRTAPFSEIWFPFVSVAAMLALPSFPGLVLGAIILNAVLFALLHSRSDRDGFDFSAWAMRSMGTFIILAGSWALAGAMDSIGSFGAFMGMTVLGHGIWNGLVSPVRSQWTLNLAVAARVPRSNAPTHRRLQALNRLKRINIDGAETPEQKLSVLERTLAAIKERLKDKGNRQEYIDGVAQLAAFMKRVERWGISSYFKIKPESGPQLQSKIRTQLTRLLARINQPSSYESFESAVEQLQIWRQTLTAYRVDKNAGLPQTPEQQAKWDAKIMSVRQRLKLERYAAALANVLQELGKYESSSKRFSTLIETPVTDASGRIQGETLARIVRNTERAVEDPKLQSDPARYQNLIAVLREFASAGRLLLADVPAAPAAQEKSVEIKAEPARAPPAEVPSVSAPAPAAKSESKIPPIFTQRNILRAVLLTSLAVFTITSILWAPEAVRILINATNFVYASSTLSTAGAASTQGLWLAGAHLSYLSVRFLWIGSEFAYRVLYAVVRRLRGISGGIAYRDPQGVLQTNGVEVDFLSNQNEVSSALQNRFGLKKEQLAGLTRGQLLRLYFNLDSQDARLARDQRQKEKEYSASANTSSPLYLRAAKIPLHFAVFLRDFFFETDLRRLRYGRQGQFIHHFDSEEQARALIGAAVERVREEAGLSFLRALGLWYGRNNVALAGLTGYMIRRLRITLFGAAGGWLFGGLTWLIPGLGMLGLDGWIRSLVPASAAGDSFVFRYFSSAVHHLSFSLPAIITTFFTAFGLQFDSQARRLHQTIVQNTTNPFTKNVRMDFESLRQNLIALKTLTISDEGRAKKYLTVLAKVDALLRAQEELPGLSPRRLSLGRTSEEERRVLRSLLGELHARVPVGLRPVGFRYDRAVTFFTGEFRAAPGIFSPDVASALWQDLKTRRFWKTQLASMWGMWTLGAEIALVVEAAGDIGGMMGAAAGRGSEGHAVGRGVANILEGEHNSAMSLMTDLQRFTFGFFNGGGDQVPSLPVVDPNVPALPELSPRETNEREREPRLEPVPARQDRVPADQNKGDRDNGRPYHWIEDWADVSGAKWSLLTEVMREQGRLASEQTHRPVELPQIPLDPDGRPLRLFNRSGGDLPNSNVSANEIYVKLSDGSLAPLSSLEYNGQTGSYLPPPHLQFVHLSLPLDQQILFVDSSGRPLRDRSGALLPATGFRVLNPGQINELRVSWKDENGTVSVAYPEGHAAVPVHPVSTNEVILVGDAASTTKALQRAELDLVIARNRAELARRQLQDKNHVAYEVDQNFAIVREFDTEKDLPDLLFYEFGPPNNPRIPFDPLQHPEKSADIITTATGNEVVFTVGNEDRAREARRDADAAFSQTVSAWSTRAYPLQDIDLFRLHNLLQSNPNGATVPSAFMIAQDSNGRLTLYRNIREAKEALNRAQVPDRLMAGFLGDDQFAHLVSGQLFSRGITFTSNDHQSFRAKFMEWYRQENTQDFVPVLVENNLNNQGRITAREAQQFRRDAEAAARQARVSMAYGSKVIHNGMPNRIMPIRVLVEDGRGRSETTVVPYLISEAEFQAYENGVDTQLSTGQWLIKPALGHQIDENGKILNAYTDPVQLFQELQRTDLIYELNTGEKVALHELPPNALGSSRIITAVIDPRTNARIITGSTWASLNYVMNSFIRIENHMKRSPAVVQVGEPSSPNKARELPWDNRYEGLWRDYLAYLKREIDGAQNPGQKNILIARYAEAVRERIIDGNFGNHAHRIILKGTADQRVGQSLRELQDINTIRDREEIQATGGGGLLIPNGALLNRINEREEIIAELDQQISQGEARIDQIRKDLNRRANPNLSAELRDRRSEVDRLERERRDQAREVSNLRRDLASQESRRLASRPASHIRTELFQGDAQRTNAAWAEQRAYIQDLRHQLDRLKQEMETLQTNAANARTREQRDRILRDLPALQSQYDVTNSQIEAARQNNSYEKNDDTVLIVGSWQAAEHRAVREADRAQRGRDVLNHMNRLYTNGGGALHEVIQPNGSSALTVEPLPAGIAVRDRFITEMKNQNASDAVIELAQRDNVFSYTQNGQTHRWTLVFSIADAEKEVARRAEADRIARALQAASGTVVYVVDPATRDRRLITNSQEISGVMRDLISVNARLEQNYTGQPDQMDALRQARHGIFWKDGKQYIVDYNAEGARERFNRVLQRYQAAHSRSADSLRRYTLTDEFGHPEATLTTDGRFFKATTARVVELGNDGLALVELRTYSSSREPTTGSLGQLIQVTREWVDSEDRVLARVSGSWDNAGRFTPRFITINQFQGPLAGLDIPAESRTYRYEENRPLSGYTGRGLLMEDFSRVLSTPDQIERTGTVEIEYRNALGNVWREIKDRSNRTIAKVEGVFDGQFQPLRRIVYHYSDARYAELNIPTESEVVDLASGQTMGRSRLLTDYSAYLRSGEIRYERWMETTREMIWEVRNSDGQLTRKYKLRPLENEQGQMAYVPFNVTVFRYDFEAENNNAYWGLPERAYTFETDSRGWIEGRFDPSDPSYDITQLPYFEHAEVVRVEPAGNQARILYRVSVRNGDGRDYQQYQEVKNGDGLLLERHNGNQSSTDEYIPVEITFNGYDFSPDQFGKYEIINRARTFMVRAYSEPNGRVFDLARMNYEPGTRISGYDENGILRVDYQVENNNAAAEFVSRLPLQLNVSRIQISGSDGQSLYSLILKDESEINGIDSEGILDYTRVVFRYVPDNNGRLTRVIHSRYQDRIAQGLWREAMDAESRSFSSVTFDNKKVVTSGRVADYSTHPSLVSGQRETGTLTEEVERVDHGVMSNPYLPDLPDQYWHIDRVRHYNRDGGVAYTGTRWLDINGQTAVEVLLKRGDDGQPQEFVALHIGDQNTAVSRAVSLANGRTLTLPLAGANGASTVDLSDTDFLYFRLDIARPESAGGVEGVATLRDADGHQVQVRTSARSEDDHEFWMPVSGHTLRLNDSQGRPRASVDLISDSMIQGRRSLFAIPVSELSRSLDMTRLVPSVQFALDQPVSGGILVEASAVARAGRAEEQRAARETVKRPTVESSGSFQLVGQTGQVAYYDATRTSEQGSGIEIRGADSRLLGVLRTYLYTSSRSGVPIEQRRLIVFDQSGRYPVASIALKNSAEGRVVLDFSDVLSFAVQEEGNRVTVYELDPTTSPRYPLATPYQMDSLDPENPKEIRIGEFNRLSSVQSNDFKSTLSNRLSNSPFNVFLRWANGESFGVPPVGLPEIDREALSTALQRFDLALLNQANARMEEILSQLPSDRRPVKETPVYRMEWEKIATLPGLLWTAMVMGPVWLFVWTWRWARKWQAWRAMVDIVKKSGEIQSRPKLYDEALMNRALARFNTHVLKTNTKQFLKKGSPVFYTSDGDIEGAFLNNLFAIYLLVFSWNEKFSKDPNKTLADLDQFALAVSHYLSAEVSRGGNPEKVRYDIKGKTDAQIWNKLEIYLSFHRNRLREALVRELSSQSLPVNTGLSFRTEFHRLMRTTLVHKGDLAEFNAAALNEFITRERFAPVPARFIIFGRYLFKLVPVLWGVVLLKGGAFTATSIIPGLMPSIVILGLGTLLVNAVTEAKAIRSSRVLPAWGRFRAVPALVTAALALAGLVTAEGLSFSLFSALSFTALLMMTEAFGLLGANRLMNKILQYSGLSYALRRLKISLPNSAGSGNRSLFGVAWWYHARPAFSIGRSRAVVLSLTTYLAFFTIALFLGLTVLPWFIDKFAAGSLFKVLMAEILFVSRMPLLHHGINIGVRFMFSWLSPTLGAESSPLAQAPPSSEKMAVMHVGGQTMASSVLAGKTVGKTGDLVQQYTTAFQDLLQSSLPGRAAMALIIQSAVTDPRLQLKYGWNREDKAVISSVESWLRQLFEAELAADDGNGTTLWSLRQLYDPEMHPRLKVGASLPPSEQAAIEYAFKIRRMLIEHTGMGGSSLDTAINFVDWAEGLADAGLARSQIFYLVHNQFEDHKDPTKSPETIDSTNRTEIGQRIKLAALLQNASMRYDKYGRRRRGVQAYVMYNHTVFGMKSAAMNADRMRPEDLPFVKSILITDRNTSYLNVSDFVKDVRRMRDNPNLLIMAARRNTTYTIDALGKTSFAIEGGHGESMKSLSDKIGTGWGSFMRVVYWDIMKEMADPSAPLTSFSAEENQEASARMNQLFGIIGFTPNAVGISEDYWAVVQQYHNMISLGRTPEMALSEGLAHKVRESRDYSEWKGAPPRWSSGLVQTMDDLLMQQINEFGPDSIFEKEARQTNADHYLLGPLVLFDLFMLPLSVVLDWSPFVGISILFWVPGIIVNQVSTLNSLLANVRHKGSWVGMSAWLTSRISDALLFPSRTVRDALAQLTGHRGVSFEFVISGGGGSMSAFQAIWTGINPKTGKIEAWFNPEKPVRSVVFSLHKAARAIWINLFQMKKPHTYLNVFAFGLVLLAVNIFALHKLDATNAVMMILSLWFAVGVAFGPMLTTRIKGRLIWKGWGDRAAKALGAGYSVLLLFGMSWLAVSIFTPNISVLPSFLTFTMIILAGSAMRFIQHLAKAEKMAQLERFTSEFRRSFWIATLLFGWFVFVPMHPLFRFDLIPGMPILFSPVQFGLFVGIAVASVVAFLLIGRLANQILKRKTLKRYVSLVKRHQLHRGNNFSIDAQIDSLMIQIITFVQQESYLYAKGALAEADRLLALVKLKSPSPFEAGVVESAEQKETTPVVKEPVRSSQPAMVGAPGSMALWRRLGITNSMWIGRWEGVLTALIPWALILAGVNGGQNPFSFGFLLSLSLFSGMIFLHKVFGVFRRSDLPVDHSWRSVLSASMAAGSGLFAVPVVMAGAIIGGWVGVPLAMAGVFGAAALHGEINRRRTTVDPSFEALTDQLGTEFRRLKSAQKSADQTAILESLRRIGAIEDLGLRDFGKQPGTDARIGAHPELPFYKQLMYQFQVLDDARSVIDWIYMTRILIRQVPDAIGLASDQLNFDAESLPEENGVKTLPMVLYAPRSRTPNDLVAEIKDLKSLLRRTSASGTDIAVAVLLNGELENSSVYLEGQVSGLRTIKASEIKDGSSLVRVLAQINADKAGRLRLIKHRESRLPDNFEKALLELGRSPDHRRLLIDIIILTSLSADGVAIKTSLSELDHMIRFRRLVSTQA